MGIGTISPKMAESQLEGDKVVDLDFTTLWAGPVLNLKLLSSTSSSSSLSSLGFLLQWRLSWIFVTSVPPTSGGWLGGLTSPIHHVQSP